MKRANRASQRVIRLVDSHLEVICDNLGFRHHEGPNTIMQFYAE